MILYLLVAVVCFYAGICVGVRDCKRRFAVPKTAVGVDADGNFIYD